MKHIAKIKLLHKHSACSPPDLAFSISFFSGARSLPGLGPSGWTRFPGSRSVRNPRGGGCSEPRSHHCTPAWVTRVKLRLEKKILLDYCYHCPFEALFLLSNAVRRGKVHNFHVTDEKPWAERGKTTCPMPPSWEVAKQSSIFVL